MEMTLYIAIIALATVCAVPVLGIRRVDEGQVAVLHRLGRTRKVLLPGLHLVVPLLDRIERRVDTIGRSVEFKQHRLADDTQVDGRVYYQILDARKAAPELEHLEETVTRELDRLLPEFLPEHRDDPLDAFNQALKQSLNERLRVRGILVARTQIQPA